MLPAPPYSPRGARQVPTDAAEETIITSKQRPVSSPRGVRGRTPHLQRGEVVELHPGGAPPSPLPKRVEPTPRPGTASSGAHSKHHCDEPAARTVVGGLSPAFHAWELSTVVHCHLTQPSSSPPGANGRGSSITAQHAAHTAASTSGAGSADHQHQPTTTPSSFWRARLHPSWLVLVVTL